MKFVTGSLLTFSLLGGCAHGADCPETAPPSAAVAVATPAVEPSVSPSPEPAAPSVVVFVRHAEKAADGTPDPPLTERGQRRAECLAILLAPFEPDRLLSSEYQRTRSTVAPLARVTGLAPAVIEAGDLEAWTAALRELPPDSRVVVSGHSNTIPAWASALGVELSGLDDKGNIPHDDYDRLIQVVLDAEGHALASTTIAYCRE